MANRGLFSRFLPYSFLARRISSFFTFVLNIIIQYLVSYISADVVLVAELVQLEIHSKQYL